MMNDQNPEVSSCDPALSRRSFVESVVRKAALAGTLTAGALIADAFLAPSPVAAASGNTGGSDGF